jgi:hypothetical protein
MQPDLQVAMFYPGTSDMVSAKAIRHAGYESGMLDFTVPVWPNGTRISGRVTASAWHLHWGGGGENSEFVNGFSVHCPGGFIAPSSICSSLIRRAVRVLDVPVICPKLLMEPPFHAPSFLPINP